MTKEEILKDIRAIDDKDNPLLRCDNDGKAMLYIVEKTAERTKREMVEKAVKWLDENVDNYCFNTGNRCEYIPKVVRKMLEDFKQAMQDESRRLD